MKLFDIRLLGFLIILLSNCVLCKGNFAVSTQDSTTLIKGIDASFIPELRSLNITVYDKDSVAIDMLDLLKNSGLNTIRLRIWHTPETVHSSFTEVKTFSNEIKNKGLKVYLNLHYSDTWADPGHQEKPNAWKNLTFNQLKDSVYVYTKNIVTDIMPDYIQIGNEINEGILFPDGSINNFIQFKELIQKGIQAVRESSPDTKIMLHYAGFQNSLSFFSDINDLDYDIIGLSYYPYWHGKNLTELENVLDNLSNSFDKEIIIAETTYPFDTLDGTINYLVPGYPASIEGQSNFIKRINSIIKNNSNGNGVCFWGGVIDAYKIPKPTPNGYYWENQAMLDYNNKFLPVLEALNDTTTSVKDEYTLPASFFIYNYPNPFNGFTIIQYEIPNDDNITLELYSSLGERITILFYGYKKAGRYEILFDGSKITSGIYFVVLKSEEQIISHKILLLK